MPSESTQFKPGNVANPKGRPKGAVNKFKFDVLSICEKVGFNPFSELIHLAKNGSNDRIKLDATAELAGYVAPKLKAIEISADEFVEGFQMVFNVNKEKVADAVNNVQRNEDSKPVSS